MSTGEILHTTAEVELEAVELNQIVNDGITKTLFYRPEDATTFVTVSDEKAGKEFQIEVAECGGVPEGKSAAAWVLDHAMAYEPTESPS